MIAIQTTDLTKKFGSKIAVDSLNLAINQGELFALLGVNGAGKTTTIKMLSCLLTPTSGDALLLGDSILTNSQRVKEKTNVSPQENAVAPNLSVEENLQFIAEIYGYNKQEAKNKTAEMLTTFRLTEVARDRAKTLSGGMQRRLSIAMALISGPEILFLDEPTLGLDVLSRRELWNTIKQLKGKVTIILTTHYMKEAASLADQIGIMAAGQLKAVGTLQELTEQTQTNNLEDAFIALASGMEV